MREVMECVIQNCFLECFSTTNLDPIANEMIVKDRD